MSKNNFKCSCCNKEYNIPSYSSVIRGDKILYFHDKLLKKPILCTDKHNKKCLSTFLTFLEKPFEGIPAFGKFASMSATQKQAFLRKRSREHSFKNNNHKDIKGFSI